MVHAERKRISLICSAMMTRVWFDEKKVIKGNKGGQSICSCFNKVLNTVPIRRFLHFVLFHLAFFDPDNSC